MSAARQDDYRWMARAIRIAMRGLYTTSPNPRVGCVIVRDGALLAEGWHEQAGGPHAEAMALARIDGSPAGATAYVSLEPCAHHGRTPPCADALIAAGLGRVVAAGLDPNPLVAGTGMARLAAAGIETLTGVLEAQAEALNPGFLRRMRGGRPWLRCKMAMSVDGRTAMASGESRWITGEAARRDVQRLRARSCAVVTGAGTVRSDDPRLDVRELDGQGPEPLHQPLRVVVQGRCTIDPDARVFARPGRVLLVGPCGNAPAPADWQARGVEWLGLNGPDGDRVDPVALLDALAARGCNEVLLECGPVLAGAFARAGLIDEYVIYMAPVLLGSSARPLLDLPLDRMAERLALRIDEITAVGEDWRICARPGSLPGG